MKLVAQTVTGLVFFLAVLFWPAGTFDYWQAWVFLAVFVATTGVGSAYLAARYPDALARRMKAGPTAETRPAQRIIMTLTLTLVVVTFVLSALDHRFGWSQVPVWLVIAGDLLVAAGLGVTQVVIVQNNYAAATVRVEAGQPLADTGLYGWVRHPMYTGAAVMMLGTPLALDSWWGLLGVLASAPVIVARIRDEERMLSEELVGYPEYMTRVRYRLVPYLW
ncbi:isoprenylcysteine carboxylmethyltransferase family protein [Mycobacterium adipatum]|jgi:protein-S-isoprenylcysteine O-methyltransferase Ste14|uniref:methyltransferase family protein n=1 Tax=Mycobacterium adipatum TaxID=1682113 RepID=UPI0034E0621E